MDTDEKRSGACSRTRSVHTAGVFGGIVVLSCLSFASFAWVDIPQDVALSRGFAALAIGFAAVCGWLWIRLEHVRQHLRASMVERDTLQDELEIYRCAVEHSPVSVVITGLDAAIRYVNPHLTQITGFELSELRDRTPSMFQSGNTENATYATMWNTLREGRFWEGELQNRRKNGELYWELMRVVPVSATNGRVQAYVGLKLDVTRRRIAEQRLAETELNFTAVLENLPCVVFQLQMDVTSGRLHFRYINERVEIYGLTVEQVLKHPRAILSATHPEDLEFVIKNTLESARNLLPQRLEYRVRRTDGQFIWIETYDAPTKLPDGSILWTGYSMDVTARHETLQRLRASEEKFRTLIESANDIIYTLDPFGCVKYASPNWTDILGHPVDEVIGRRFDELLHPDDLAVSRDLLARILSSARKQSGVEYRVRHLDGTWVWHIVNGAPLLDPDGTVNGMLGIARDISERKEDEARILHMAHYDALTDLPNRSLFLDRLQQALQLAARHQRRLALMFVDLDRFKPINDTYGHAVGDHVLQEAAQRMSKALRGSDAVGRMGGDEFAVLLSEIDSVHTAFEVRNKIYDAIRQPIHIGDLELEVSCSIGVAIYPDHGTDAPTLFHHADLAMYDAKESGRNSERLTP